MCSTPATSAARSTCCAAGTRDRWCSDGLDVFRAIDRIDDPFRLRLAYDRGVLEPLGRATFKVIPARYLDEQDNKDADDADSPRARSAPGRSGTRAANARALGPRSALCSG